MDSNAGVADEALGSSYRGNSRPEVMALLPPLKAGAKVLEVGCGEGAFIAGLPGRPETWGIEPDVRSAGIAKGRLNRVMTTTYNEVKADLPLNYFDLVVCNDVIEHMTDHDAFLRDIQVHMADGALIVGSLPNVRHYKNLFNLLALCDWHYQDEGILDRTHFRFFTFRSLRRSLESAGLSVLRLEGLNETKPNGLSIRDLAEHVFKTGLICLSAGTARDVRFVQIGFVAQRDRR
jgi:2-polyprenyl-3-methyl-5-hydroxy-6-metoxy-1,4-benzoquinol methylase